MAPYTKDDLQSETSFPDLSYPSLRDGGNQNGDQWIDGKVLDDGAEGLWRIHDKIYDFSDFTKRHPGGEYWLTRTKGTDITEAFEAHHVSLLPESMLKSFYSKDAITKRHSPFTFKPDGFYRTLKGRVREKLKTLDPGCVNASKRIIDFLVLGMFVFSIAASSVNLIWMKAGLCLMAGVFMAWSIISSHNFTHQKDNYRMYVFHFSFSTTREWRVGHALSHHLYPNTLLDSEISVYEPYFQWLPRKTKSTFEKYGPILYQGIIYIFIFDIQLLNLLRGVYHPKNGPKFYVEDLTAFSLPLAMCLFGYGSISHTLIVWLIIVHIGSFVFYIIANNAAHHHPDIFHDGDSPIEDRDWGLHQLHAVMDRNEINGSEFRVLTHFGEHGLHHLFPSLDHAFLPSLHKILLETCQEFQTKLKMTSQLDMFIGGFKQIARTERNLKNGS